MRMQLARWQQDEGAVADVLRHIALHWCAGCTGLCHYPNSRGLPHWTTTVLYRSGAGTNY
jgi:hypothetical protein